MTATVIPLSAARARVHSAINKLRDERTAAVRTSVRDYANNLRLPADQVHQCIGQALTQLTNGRSAFYAIKAGKDRADLLRERQGTHGLSEDA